MTLPTQLQLSKLFLPTPTHARTLAARGIIAVVDTFPVDQHWALQAQIVFTDLVPFDGGNNPEILGLANNARLSPVAAGELRWIRRESLVRMAFF